MNYATKLNAISDKKKKLLEEEFKLINQRKNEIGDLAERLGALDLSDELLVEFLQMAKEKNAIGMQS
jgi:hypothetical protein